MPPAARLSDMTAHGGLVSVGFPTVLIGGLPAARIGDMHTCPMVTGPVPHVGGPVTMGAYTVLIGGTPAARMGDMCTCVGPPDSIVKGEPRVMIGMAGGGGAAAMAMGMALARLALIRAKKGPSYPRAVEKNGEVITEYSSSVSVAGNSEFQALTIRDLDQVAETESGKAMLASMDATGKQCVIVSDQGKGPSASTKTGGWKRNPDGSPGAGANAIIAHDPELKSIKGPPGSPYNDAESAKEPNMPADVALYHEMVHADDYMNGTIDPGMGANQGPMAGTQVPNSELRAAGLPPHDGAAYSENAYRAEKGLAPRTFY